MRPLTAVIEQSHSANRRTTCDYGLSVRMRPCWNTTSPALPDIREQSPLNLSDQLDSMAASHHLS